MLMPPHTPTCTPVVTTPPLPPHRRPAPPAVLFGLLILLAPAVAAATYSMKWGLSATFLVACLWALNAVVMFLGMGEPNKIQLNKWVWGGGRWWKEQGPGMPCSARQTRALEARACIFVEAAASALQTHTPCPRLPSPGMLNGAKGVANDACLYGEEAVIRLLNETIKGDARGTVRATQAVHAPRLDAAACRLCRLHLRATTVYGCACITCA